MTLKYEWRHSGAGNPYVVMKNDVEAVSIMHYAKESRAFRSKGTLRAPFFRVFTNYRGAGVPKPKKSGFVRQERFDFATIEEAFAKARELLRERDA